jgi:hypothetical protein
LRTLQGFWFVTNNVPKEENLSFPKRAGLMILPWVSLFPGGLLPLRIFEERYRRVIERGDFQELLRHRFGDRG